MAPSVHPDRVQGEDSGHSAAGRGRGGGRGRGNSRGRGGRGASRGGQSAPGGIPSGSISKLKAQIRQTTRLLARDDLTPDVRITSERRLKTLEAELIKTTEESAKTELEKKMASKYRGVRFFERQKILRKIKQAKKALVATPSDATLAQSLLESRIDLYYVLQYPKTSKYVALFPDGTYVPHSPPPATSTSKKDASITRFNLRESIKKKMSEGVLGAEPEGGDLGIEGEEDVEKEEKGSKKRSLEAETATEEKEERSAPEPKSKKVKKEKSSAEKEIPVAQPVATVAEPVVQEEVEEVESPVKEKQKGRESKADKKARKEKKKEKGKKGAESVPAEVAAQAEGWAGEDDFFS